VGFSAPRDGQGPEPIFSFKNWENGFLLVHFLLPLLLEELKAKDLE